MSITVNGEILEQAIIDQEQGMLRQRYSERLSPEDMAEREATLPSDAKENAIERLLLSQEARRQFPSVTSAEVDRELEKLLKQFNGPESITDIPEQDREQLKTSTADGIRLDKLFKEICRDVTPPTGEECRTYYESHKDAFVAPEMIRASHILRQPSPDEDFGAFQAAMLNIREQAAQGADFAKLAVSNSSCNDNGGDLGWFPRGRMVESFENAVFSLQPGQVSDVFRTEFGFHIAKVMDRRPAGPIPFEAVAKKIKELILEQRKNDAIGVAVDHLRETAQIVETPDKA